MLIKEIEVSNKIESTKGEERCNPTGKRSQHFNKVINGNRPIKRCSVFSPLIPISYRIIFGSCDNNKLRY